MYKGAGNIVFFSSLCIIENLNFAFGRLGFPRKISYEYVWLQFMIFFGSLHHSLGPGLSGGPEIGTSMRWSKLVWASTILLLLAMSILQPALSWLGPTSVWIWWWCYAFQFSLLGVYRSPRSRVVQFLRFLGPSTGADSVPSWVTKLPYFMQ